MLEAMRLATKQSFRKISSMLSTVTFVEKGDVTYDPATGTGTEYDTSYPVDGLIQEVESSEVDDEKILKGDLWATFIHDELRNPPEVGDSVTYDDQDWTVKKAGDQKVVWELLLRGK